MFKENECVAESDKENTNTQNVTGKVTSNLKEVGDDPEKWNQILQDCLKLDNTLHKKRMLKQFFLQAKKNIDPAVHRRSETYARILAQEALFISLSSRQDAGVAFRFATDTCRPVPFIHVAFAQYEVDSGRLEKAKKILELGKMVLPDSKEISDAIKRLKSNETNLGLKNDPMFNSSVLRDNTNSMSTPKVAKYDFGDSIMKIFPTSKHSLTDTCIKSPIRPAHIKRELEALDFPESPRPPTFVQTPSGKMMTPIQKNRSSVTKPSFFGITTPSPPRLSFSVTKSLANRHALQTKQEHLTTSVQKPMMTSKTNGQRSGPVNKPRRIPCALQPENDQKHKSEYPMVFPLASEVGATPTDNRIEKVFPTQPVSQVSASPTRPTFPPPIRQPQPNLAAHAISMSPAVRPSSVPTPTPARVPHTEPPATANLMPPPASLPVARETDEIASWMNNVQVLRIHHKSYIVLKVIGEGGSSKVFEVFDVAAKQIKAVKHVSLKNCDAAVKKGFLDEVKFLEQLRNNPNIVHLYTYELTGDDLYLVMECGSTDLSKSLKRNNGRLEPYEVWYFWKKMLAALNTVHQHGIIHLDLKPANFLIVKGTLKLIDFGIANSIQSDVTSVFKDTMVGTLNYMAPEAIVDMSSGGDGNDLKFKISPRADVWSLGCILYLMMYGRTPFQHINHQIRKLSAITNPNTRIEFPQYGDKRLIQIVQSCLMRDAKRRPTVEQLIKHS
uniref:Dual specificity protein kinase TTK-like n=1 Tax=Phallusia mammillata TaxID=59560 RepID=A0A6F9DV99_9ASCI|nr:dual specificity protein kinase TTK-like [Phallusia mammillata]